MSEKELGCCGAYCKTCRAFRERTCPGCKLGYDSGERDIAQAKCRMKVCCVKQGLNSCADCPDYPECGIIREFHGKNGYKYGKYRQAIEFIRQHGYAVFFELADKWKNAYGKY